MLPTGTTTVDAASLPPAQLVAKAYKRGATLAGLWIGVPFFLLAWVCFLSGRLADNDRGFGAVALGYMVLVVLPCASCLSAAMVASAVPVEETRRSVRAIFKEYAFALIPVGAVFLGSVWRWRHSKVHVPQWALPTAVVLLILAVGTLAVGCAIGYRLGTAARRNTHSRISRLLKQCWQGV